MPIYMYVWNWVSQENKLEGEAAAGKKKGKAGEEMRGGAGANLWELSLHGLYMVGFSAVNKLTERILELADWYYARIWDLWKPRVEISVSETSGNDWYDENPLFTATDNYLCSSASMRVRRLTGDADGHSNITYSMERGEHVFDVFDHKKGGRFVVRWDYYVRRVPRGLGGEIERRYYKLSFDPRDRQEVVERYLKHVMKTSEEIEKRRCPKKLYTNSKGGDDDDDDHMLWQSVPFKHPGTFATLAMDSRKKQIITDDLTAFTKSRDYYSSIGKAWKRGYLLYGPPGTGKSTMVAAIANFLDYDVYDLELTAVSSNGELRQLMIATKSRSVIVIEDIDCSLDLTHRRGGMAKKKKKKDDDGAASGEASGVKDDESSSSSSDSDGERKKKKKKKNRVTLSGLLNSVDGLWSVCCGERIIVFTTNHPERLDPALLRRGRMDMHIELSYCCFEAFKVLAKNYLDLDDHPLFEEVRQLLGEIKIVPAAVAEHLMPKIAPLAATGAREDDQQQIQVKNIPPEVKAECLRDLIRALHEASTDGKKKTDKSPTGEAKVDGGKKSTEKAEGELQRRRPATTPRLRTRAKKS